MLGFEQPQVGEKSGLWRTRAASSDRGAEFVFARLRLRHTRLVGSAILGGHHLDLHRPIGAVHVEL